MMQSSSTVCRPAPNTEVHNLQASTCMLPKMLCNDVCSAHIARFDLVTLVVLELKRLFVDVSVLVRIYAGLF